MNNIERLPDEFEEQYILRRLVTDGLSMVEVAMRRERATISMILCAFAQRPKVNKRKNA